MAITPASHRVSMVSSTMGLPCICSTLFLLRVSQWACADLWYDEIVTLANFVVAPTSLMDVFRTYPVANNHILFSALSWCLFRVTGGLGTEIVLRLPSVAMGALTVWLAAYWWRKWLGAWPAFLAGLSLAVSPVFGPFACQFRGYSLSMLLGCVAVGALMDISFGRFRRGVLTYAGMALLMPLVIPTNVLTVIAHIAFLVLNPATRLSRRQRIQAAVAMATATTVGASYYLTILAPFLNTIKQTAGWQSGWLVMGHCTLAMLAHMSGVLVLALLPGHALRQESADCFPHGVAEGLSARDIFCPGMILVASACLPMVAAVLILSPAPYPRVFLPLLPTLTFAVTLLAKRRLAPHGQTAGTASSAATRAVTHPVPDTGVGETPRAHSSEKPGPTLREQPGLRHVMAALVVVASGLAWEWGASALNRRQLALGRYPQNLLQQYYRGWTGFSSLSQWLTENDPQGELTVVVDPHEFPTLRYYGALAGRSPDRTRQAGNGKEAFWGGQQPGQRAQIGAVVANKTRAEQLLAEGGRVDNLKLIWTGPQGYPSLYVGDIAP